MSKKAMVVLLSVCAMLALAVPTAYANYVQKIDLPTLSLSVDGRDVLQSVSVTTPPNKTDYNSGENFDATGMVVSITHTDGTTAVVNDYTILNGTNMQTTQTSVTISYTKDGVTKTTTLPITISSEPTLPSTPSNNTEPSSEPGSPSEPSSASSEGSKETSEPGSASSKDNNETSEPSSASSKSESSQESSESESHKTENKEENNAETEPSSGNGEANED